MSSDLVVHSFLQSLHLSWLHTGSVQLDVTPLTPQLPENKPHRNSYSSFHSVQRAVTSVNVQYHDVVLYPNMDSANAVIRCCPKSGKKTLCSNEQQLQTHVLPGSYGVFHKMYVSSFRLAYRIYFS